MERQTHAATQPQGHPPRISQRQIALPTLLCLLLVMTTAPASAQTETHNPFGVVEGFWFPEMTCELGVGWERIIFDWAQHQPNDPTDWHTLNVDDRWLKAANQCNQEVVGLLKNTPTWATSGIPGAGVPDGLYLPVDDPQNHWANFVRQTARYYAPRGVNRFIIWNEPDISRETYGFEFEGTLDDYAQMLTVAAVAAKQGNPAAKVHLAGTTYWHDVNAGERLYLDRLLERISQLPDADQHDYYFDAVSLHIYFRTDSVYEIVNEVRGLLEQHGMGHKAIWINETNAPPTQDPDWPVDRPVFQYTLDQQAAFLVQAAALGKAAGAERIAVYKLYDQELPPGGETFGILRPNDQSPRPAFEAWHTVAVRFGAVTSAQRHSTPTVDSVLIERGDGAQVLALWARTGDDVAVTVRAEGGQVYGQLDANTPVQAVDGETELTLPAANCNGDDPAVPCPVGGAVTLIETPGTPLTVHEVGAGGTMTPLWINSERQNTNE